MCLTSNVRSPLRHSRSTFSGPAFPTRQLHRRRVNGYTVEFNASNWFIPVIVAMHARNDCATEDPHNTTITHTVDRRPR